MPVSTVESALAQQLCEDLSATDLKQIYRARGFPVLGGSKPDLVRGLSCRLLEPLGVPEAMAEIEPRWLAALHLIAASPEPLPLRELASALNGQPPYSAAEFQAVWRQLVPGLLHKGVLLFDEQAQPPRWQSSTLARVRLLLPEGFRRFLPPFPVPTQATTSSDELGSPEAPWRQAIASLAGGSRRRGKPTSLAERLAAHLALEDGRLQLKGVEHPKREHLAQRLAAAWEAGLVHRGDREPPLGAGLMARHILRHLPEGVGVTAAALAQAMRALAVNVTPEDVAAFCEEGAAAGLLACCRKDGGQAPLYGPASAPGPDNDESLAVNACPTGARIDPFRSSPLQLFEAGAVARAALDDGALVLAPDPVRLGRSWREVEASPALAALRAACPAFESACRAVQARHGAVQVHRGLTVLRVSDAGLRALLCDRFSSAVIRELGAEYLAVLDGKREEILAFAKKEGFAARRLS